LPLAEEGVLTADAMVMAKAPCGRLAMGLDQQKNITIPRRYT